MKDEKIKKCLIAGYDLNIINQEELNEYWNYINDLLKENERLNNIINELENEIERINKLKNPKKGIKPYGEENYYYENMILRYKEVLDRLKELKGSDK